MTDFFMNHITAIPRSDDATDHTNGYKGIRFWALLCCVDACLDLGITCTEKCASETSELCIKLLLCLCVPLDKYLELMQHPQASTHPHWLPGAMWQMAKNYRTKFQNGVLPFYNKLGSGQTWHDAYECTKKALWHEYATKSKLAQEKNGVNGCMDVHVPKLSYSNMILWGLTDYGLCNGCLNINLRGRGAKAR
jgi:hypothetical protein